MTERNIAKAAREYVQRHGVAIVPIEPMRKFPRAADWGEKVITDPQIAESFFIANPDWNMGAALYHSNLCSLDVDDEAYFRIICDAFGICYEQLQRDYPAIGGSGNGFRAMFRVPKDVNLQYHKISWRPESDPKGEKHRQLMREAREAKSAGFDELEAELRERAREFSPRAVFELRAAMDGKQRQDVLPPSIHPDTEKPYYWITPIKGEIPELPAWLLTIWTQFESNFKRQFMAACPWAETDEIYKQERSNSRPSFYSSDGGLVAIARDYERAMRIEDSLENYGYKRVGRSRYISPYSSTGLAGVVLFRDNKCWIHHASDPLCSDASGKPVSSFDLFCEHEFNGDFSAAAKSLAEAQGARTSAPSYTQPPVGADVPPVFYDAEIDNARDEVETSPAPVAQSSSLEINTLAELPWTGSNSKPLNHHENLAEICRRAGITIRYNVMKKEEEIIIPGASYSTDNEANASLAELASICSLFEYPTGKLQEFVTLLADKNQYHPVCRWIESKPWDGVPRIEFFLATVQARGACQKLKNKLIFRWMVSAVRAAFSPTGVQASGVLVFAGAQGIGKTSWLKRLVPKKLNESARMVQDGVILDTGDKDSVLQTVSHWIVELGEMDASFKRSEQSQFKAFLTRDVDIMRRPYARKDSTYARRTVLFGSVNNADYLQDDTGNRRFWTVDCERIDYEHDFDMQQVWAEIYELYKKGEQWHLTPDEMSALNSHNKGFEAGDYVKDGILSAFDWGAERATWGYMRTTDILHKSGIDRPTRGDITRAAIFVRDLNGNQSERCRQQGRMLLVPPPLYMDEK